VYSCNLWLTSIPHSVIHDLPVLLDTMHLQTENKHWYVHWRRMMIVLRNRCRKKCSLHERNWEREILWARETLGERNTLSTRESRREEHSERKRKRNILWAREKVGERNILSAREREIYSEYDWRCVPMLIMHKCLSLYHSVCGLESFTFSNLTLFPIRRTILDVKICI